MHAVNLNMKYVLHNSLATCNFVAVSNMIMRKHQQNYDTNNYLNIEDCTGHAPILDPNIACV